MLQDATAKTPSETPSETPSDPPKPAPETSVSLETSEEMDKAPEEQPEYHEEAIEATSSGEGFLMRELSLPDHEDTDSTSSRSETPKSYLSEPPPEDMSPSVRTRRSGRKSPGAATAPGLEGGPMGTRTRSTSGSLTSAAAMADRDADGMSDQDGVTTRKRSSRHNAKGKFTLIRLPNIVG